jgi:cytochrome c oxidase subunit 2
MERFLALPEIASEHGASIDQMIELLHWLMLALGVGWGLFFIYVLFRFRKGANPKASYEGAKGKPAKFIEIGVVIVEAVLLIGFSMPLWAERVAEFPPEEESTVVRVVGEQFAWNVHYPGEDGIFGKTDVEMINLETNPLGLDRASPGADDDITTVNQLHLPVNKPVIVKLSSKDVIHSFALQEMRVKQDAVPGMEVPVWFTPTVTTDEMRERKGNPEYNYEISCAQLCGLGHYRMRGFMTIHTPDSYQAWLDEQAQYLGGDEGDDFWE